MSLVIPARFEDNANSIHSDSEDNEAPEVSSSSEIAERDRAMLDEEDEREELLALGSSGTESSMPPGRRLDNNFVSNGKGGRWDRRKRCITAKRRRQSNEEGELMYEMEEGGKARGTSSDSSGSSAELDRHKLRKMHDRPVCETRVHPFKCWS